MVEPAKREPSMDEIVVALRETRRDAGQTLPFAVARGQTVWTDVADLRDNEIERLLAENAHLNERVVLLLKVMEREHAARAAERAAGRTLDAAEAGAVFREMKAALEAELRPLLLVLLRLLEKRQTEPPSEGTRRTRREPEAAPSAWIVNLIRRLDSDGQNPVAGDNVTADAERLQPNLRERMALVRDALRRAPQRYRTFRGNSSPIPDQETDR
jgi:hypothetical protein